MTVSPDGRFAAMKLKKDMRNLYENATSDSIVLFSLTGEKVFGGETYKVISNGSSLTGSGNRIQYAASLALTDQYLYFLIGTQSPSSGSTSLATPMYYQSWSGHFLMRYEILGGAPSAEAHPSASGDSSGRSSPERRCRRSTTSTARTTTSTRTGHHRELHELREVALPPLLSSKTA